jgi:hypothetical protein
LARISKYINPFRFYDRKRDQEIIGFLRETSFNAPPAARAKSAFTHALLNSSCKSNKRLALTEAIVGLQQLLPKISVGARIFCARKKKSFDLFCQ